MLKNYIIKMKEYADRESKTSDFFRGYAFALHQILEEIEEQEVQDIMGMEKQELNGHKLTR